MKIDLNIISTELVNMSTIASNISNILSDISSIQTGVSSNWSGEASDAFKSKYKMLTDTFDSFNTVLQECVSYVDAVIQAVNQIEQANTNAVENMFD